MKIKLTQPNAIVPTKGSEQAAGFDLYSCITEIINPGETKKIGTGIAVEIPEGYFGAVFARSGLATKQGLRPANCVGVIDSDYRGEVMVALHNDSDCAQGIATGDRIAQLVVIPYLITDIQIAYELSDTERGDGGFGHTGK